MNFLKQVTSGISDTHLLSDGGNSSEFTGAIDTGSYILNAALTGSLYGGVPNNKIIGFAGDPATGKTFFVLGVVKHFLDSDPKAGVIYFDTEAAVTKKMMEDRGIDVKRVIISEPVSIEEFRTNAMRMLSSYVALEEKKRPPLMFCLDSLGMLSSNKELEDVESGKGTRDMTKAQLLRGAFRVLALKLAKAKVPLLVTNHTYDAVGAYVPTKIMTGGGGLKYGASTILFLSKSKERDATTKEQLGNIITVKMEKSRFTKEGSKVEVRLSFDGGLDKYYGLIDLAVKHDIWQKGAKNYVLPDGSKPSERIIYNNPEKYFTPEVMALLEEAASKEFKYGQGEAPSDPVDDLEEMVEDAD
jgi:RecA/RadA recombinase